MRQTLAALILLSSCATAEEKRVDIPLETIWAYDMPGIWRYEKPRMRDVQELEPEIFERIGAKPSTEQAELQKKSLVIQFGSTLDTLVNLPTLRERAGKAFAVAGTGREALQNAYRVRVERKSPSTSFSQGTDMSLVFFSHQFGDYITLDEVFRQGSKIVIRYRVVPRETQNLTAHFALIPLGKLPSAVYQVEVVGPRAPHASARDQLGEEVSRHVSKGFSFTVD
jgi:hypothetical protein